MNDKELIKIEINAFYGKFSIESARRFYNHALKAASERVEYYKRILKAVKELEKEEI